jgi:hypothetical protein
MGGDGIDGGGNLVQDGTESDVSGTCVHTRDAWYEDCCTLDPSEHVWNGFAVNDLDWIYAYADSNYSISGGNYYYIQNQTTGQQASATEYSYPSTDPNAKV